MKQKQDLIPMEGEVWKDIEGFEGLYQCSSEGRIRSVDRITTMKNGVRRRTRGTVLSPSLYMDGYLRYRLCKNGKHMPFGGHKLVAEAFIPNPENKPIVHHKNRNRSDNRVENLEWMTYEEHQMEHSKEISNGLKGRHLSEESRNKIAMAILGRTGKECPNSIPIVQLSKDGEFIREWDSMSDVMRELGIPTTTISKCCRWKRKTAGGYIWKYSA